MIKEEKLDFTSIWCKYNKYIIQEKDNIIYVLPDKNSKPSTYNPFDLQNELLKDLLFIGKMVFDYDKVKSKDKEVELYSCSMDKDIQSKILEFVNKYGLLGFYSYLPENRDFMDNPNISVNLGNNKIVSKKDFEYKYFCFDDKVDWKDGMHAEDYFRNSGLDNTLKQKEGDRLNDIIHSKSYCEPITDILEFASKMYELKYLINQYTYANDDDDLKDFYKNLIETNGISKTTLKLSFVNEKLKLNLNYSSLAAIIESMLLFNETNGRNEVKLCKYCGKPFIPKNIKSEYDTAQCRNKSNVYKNRAKNK